MIRLLLGILFFFGCSLLQGQEEFRLKNHDKILFLGDSNTYAGEYVTIIDAYLMTRIPEQEFEVINLGLPSETITGLSEPDHPFPRPNVHDRLEKALSKIKPNWVVISYGMNDGIYYPFDEKRFKQYQDGINKALILIKRTGAKPIILTPPVFDAKPVQKSLRKLKSESFSWVHPYENYDAEVLEVYNKWLLTLRENKERVVDLHTPMKEYLGRMREVDPKYSLAGDGVHFGWMGHLIVAKEILQEFHAPALVELAEFGTKKPMENIREYSDEKGLYRFQWKTKIPLPINPKWNLKQIQSEHIFDRINTQLIRGQFIRDLSYEFFADKTLLGEIPGEELSSGLNVLRFPKFPSNQNLEVLWKKIDERRVLLGNAWLAEVGHKRPGTPKGLPIEEAKKKAKILETEIRKLAEPVEILIRFVPLKKAS